jgi:hypothetical protein
MAACTYTVWPGCRLRRQISPAIFWKRPFYVQRLYVGWGRLLCLRRSCHVHTKRGQPFSMLTPEIEEHRRLVPRQQVCDPTCIHTCILKWQGRRSRPAMSRDVELSWMTMTFSPEGIQGVFAATIHLLIRQVRKSGCPGGLRTTRLE